MDWVRQRIGREVLGGRFVPWVPWERRHLQRYAGGENARVVAG